MNRHLFTLLTLPFFILACSQEPEQSGVVTGSQSQHAERGDEGGSVSDLSYRADVVPDGMSVQEKKERFRQLLLPAVKIVYEDLRQQHDEVKSLITTGAEPDTIRDLMEEYKAASEDDLLERINPHPVSIVLAQAAMESAWGTSRFFVEANNVFGVWSFDSKEPRIAAAKKRGDRTIWLKKYASIEDSVRDNYKVLARGAAYSEFRKMRMTTRDPFELVKGLDRYSELGSRYGEELASVIRYNKFNYFDL